MTNLEWLIENRPEIFSRFGCSECDSQGGDRCLESGGCARGHIEWLMQPRESASEGERGHVSVSDDKAPAKEENEPVTDADSREKLELDIRGSLGFTTKDVFGWLDRQAAITERETVTECDRLKQRIVELEGRSCPGYEIENHRCRWHDADFELNADRLNDLRRENAKLKKRIDELNHAENAPETPNLAENPQKTPERVCRTCRWFEPEKWVKTGKGTENFRHAKCHRGPGSFPTDADDWCGEWSA